MYQNWFRDAPEARTQIPLPLTCDLGHDILDRVGRGVLRPAYTILYCFARVEDRPILR
jgi:hypothetical protein